LGGTKEDFRSDYRESGWGEFWTDLEARVWIEKKEKWIP
jgi:hypothetical protein